jgi:undecaprenyl-diphosphatase
VVPTSDETVARRNEGRVAARLVGVLLVLLGVTAGLGHLLTRADEGAVFERLDRSLVSWFTDRRTATLDVLSDVADELGNTLVVVALATAAAAGGGLLHRSRRPAVLLAVALGGELAVFLTTTALIDRPRPPVPHLDAELPPTSSFPSGHTAAAVCLYGVLAALVLVHVRSRGGRVAVLACAAGVGAVVAAARLYRGAHYPSDVVGSLVLAVPWLLATLWAIGLPPVTRRSGVGEWARD